jgi:hypothetical protein
MASAKERKERQPEPEAKPGRSGRVKIYTIRGTKGEKQKRQAINKAFLPAMGKSEGLSAEARFDMLKPREVHPLEWFRLFTPNEELWEAIREEAIAAVQSGEMEKYDGPVGR